MTSAPCALSAAASVADCDSARVMTTRFPASGDGGWSPTLPIDLLENFARAGIDEELCDALPKLASLIGRSGSTLANMLRTIGRADYGVDGELAAFEARPCAERNLAAAFESGEQCAFGDDGLTSFEIVDRRESFGEVVVL